MNKSLKALTIVLSLGLALMLTACGSGTTVNVVITDFTYDQPAYTVPAGAQVTLNVRNNGSFEREFAIMKLGTSVTPPFGDKDEGNIFWELDEIGPGTSKSGTFTAPTEPGTYEVICGLSGHIEKGMVSTLVVK